MILLVSPAVVASLSGFHSDDIGHKTVSLLAPVLIFLIPVFMFYRNLRWYFYFLLPLVVLTPLFLFSTFYFGVQPGFELVAFILQTNPREAKEAVTPFLIYLIPFQLLYVTLYVYLFRFLPPAVMSAKRAAGLSLASLTLLVAITVYGNGLYYKEVTRITKADFFLKYDYPFSLAFGAKQAMSFLARNNIDQAKDFYFRPVKKDSSSARQVFVLIIGESSRYDRWQVNGYPRQTSPRLAAREDLLTFSDVVAGAHYTWASVPQIITRADPDNYHLQYREKSILAAFREAGFRTYWLSNQSDQDIFWSGSIILHARTADYYTFSPSYSPNLEYDRVYDGRLLPLVDSVLRHDHHNLFIVVHTMGNHWDYSQRYPPEFDLFQPSGYTETINPPHAGVREALLNSYDNSIAYADHIIDSVITMVNKDAGVSSVTFISDHGEDLFDADPEKIDFHFRPSAATLRVPLFMWSSESYKKMFRQKWTHLEGNTRSKVGAGNLFHTLIDLANLRMAAFDSTRSMAHPSFVAGAQKFFGDDKKARSFEQIAGE